MYKIHIQHVNFSHWSVVLLDAVQLFNVVCTTFWSQHQPCPKGSGLAYVDIKLTAFVSCMSTKIVGFGLDLIIIGSIVFLRHIFVCLVMSAIREKMRSCARDTCDSNWAERYYSIDEYASQRLIVCATCLAILHFVCGLITGIWTVFGYSNFWIALDIESVYWICGQNTYTGIWGVSNKGLIVYLWVCGAIWSYSRRVTEVSFWHECFFTVPWFSLLIISQYGTLKWN